LLAFVATMEPPPLPPSPSSFCSPAPTMANPSCWTYCRS
jgi:hypothetical protein